MTATAAALVIASAFMHAGWNFVSKRSNPSLAFFFAASLGGVVCIVPVLVWFRPILSLISPAIWVLVALTGVAQAVYMSGLAGAYRSGDISLAYPLARALPVLMVAGVSVLLGNGATIGRISLIGMVLITLGCIILPHQTFRTATPRNYLNTVCVFALVAAIGTTGYTTIDDQAMRLLRDNPTVSLTRTEVTVLFIALQISSTALMIGLATRLNPASRTEAQAIFADRKRLATGMLTGVVIMATYGLALAAMAYVTNVSYVAAFRQLSIPIGATMGIVWQNERAFRPKIIGIITISIGLILVAFG